MIFSILNPQTPVALRGNALMRRFSGNEKLFREKMSFISCKFCPWKLDKSELDTSCVSHLLLRLLLPFLGTRNVFVSGILAG